MSETRTFSGYSGTYTLNYAYNFANALTSLGIPFRSQQVGYIYDTAARLSGVTASGFSATHYVWPNQYTQNLTSFASNITYRAWGGRKSMTYGNTTTEQTTYNSRMLPATHTLSNMNYQNTNICCNYPTYSTMAWTYGYYDDGRLKNAWDSTNEWFDRAYKYDHVGRLTEASTYRRARGLSPYPAISNPDPYHQTITYDAFNHSSRTGLLYTGVPPSDNGTYVNNRRIDSGWQYDADGNNTRSDDYQQTVDAAGALTHSVSHAMVGDAIQYPLQPRLDITQTYDGDGRRSKRDQISRMPGIFDEFGNQGEPIEDAQTVYHVNSTVLGGATVVELEATNTVHIYAGGQRIAREVWGNISFEHHNPVTGSWVTSSGHSSYRITNREERDARGAEIPLSNAYGSTQSYIDWKFGQPLFIEGSDPFDYNSGFTVDGLPVSESQLERMLDRGTAVAGLFAHGQMVGFWNFTGRGKFGMSGGSYWIPETVQEWVGGGTDLNIPHDSPDDGVIRTWTDETNGQWVDRIVGYRSVSHGLFPSDVGRRNPHRAQQNGRPLTPEEIEKVRRDMAATLENPGCAMFIRGVLRQVALNTKIPLFSDDVIKNFNQVLKTGAIRTVPLPRGEGQAWGSAGGGDATIEFNSRYSLNSPFPHVVGMRGLHETTHVSTNRKMHSYSDYDLARAAYRIALAQGYKDVPTPPDTFDSVANSTYYNDRIFIACRPEWQRKK